MSLLSRPIHFLVLVSLSTMAMTASAQSGDETRKAARRAQLQMQNLQQQAQEAQAAKAKAEAEKVAADKQLAEQGQQMAKLKGALPQTQKKLKDVEIERDTLAARVTALEKQLADQKTATEQQSVRAQRFAETTAQWRDEVSRRYEAQVVQIRDCSAKNDKLARLNVSLVDRYRNKGVTDVIRHSDPLFGLGDVEAFNQMQEMRDQVDAERTRPVAAVVPLPVLPTLPEVLAPRNASTHDGGAP